MNFGQLAVKAVIVMAILYLLSLAGAVTLPALSAFTITQGGLLNLLIFLFAMLFIALFGYLLGKGVRTVKKPFEAVILVLAAAFLLGSILVLYTILRVPYVPGVNLGWLGTHWYSPWLTVFFMGATLMLVFLVGD